MSFYSNVQQKIRRQPDPWECAKCGAKVAGERYSCDNCPEGRRPK